jgi:hypothetical protein
MAGVLILVQVERSCKLAQVRGGRYSVIRRLYVPVRLHTEPQQRADNHKQAALD